MNLETQKRAVFKLYDTWHAEGVIPEDILCETISDLTADTNLALVDLRVFWPAPIVGGHK